MSAIGSSLLTMGFKRKRVAFELRSDTAKQKRRGYEQSSGAIIEAIYWRVKMLRVNQIYFKNWT